MARLARLAAPALAFLALAGCAGDDGPPAAAPAAPAAQAPAPAAPAVRAAAPAAPAPGAAATTAQAPPAAAPETRPPPAVLVVRRRGGVPDRWGRRLERTPGVAAVTRVARTQLLSTTGAPRAGYAYLLDAVVVAPRAFAAVTGVAAARDVRGGRVLLSETSARLRELGPGDRLRLTRGAARVAGVVPDAAALGAEVVVSGADVPARERRNAQLLVATTDPQRAAGAVPEDRLTRVSQLGSAPSPTPTRGGIARPMELKERFGEFAVALPLGADWITVDPAWVRRTIVTRRVPILGAVTCHRAFVPPLRRVLARVVRRGLARLVDPGDFAGCYAPRRIPTSGSLSLHAWGLAIDLNASANPQGARPRQDLRLVHLFEDEGFTWGGRWPTAPDGMHFELHGDPG